MRKNTLTRFLATVLTVCLLLGNLAPVTIFAAEDTQTDSAATVDANAPQETTVPQDTTTPATDLVVQSVDELKTEDYATFLAELKLLEGLAANYAATSGKDAGELILNFLRTGVDRYNDGNWKTLAGEEITGFTDYVSAQDAANGTTVMTSPFSNRLR